MFNKTYQARANRRGDLLSVKEILGELVRKADADPRFYRPAQKPDPRRRAGNRARNPRLQGVQLELDFAKCEVDPEKPLLDLFPEAYSE